MIGGRLGDNAAVAILEIEEFVENFGGEVERRVGEDFVGFGRQADFPEILLDDADVFDVVFLEVGTEFRGGSAVRFNRPNFADAFR